MKSIERIQAEIEALDEEKKWYLDDKEIKLLSKLIHDDENIRALTMGRKPKTVTGYEDVYMVCTDRRVLIVSKGLLKVKTEEIALSGITEIRRKDGIIFSQLKIMSTGRKGIKIKYMNKNSARAFCSEVQTVPIVTREDDNSKISAAEELKGLKELLDEGIISQEEFDAKKKNILGI